MTGVVAERAHPYYWAASPLSPVNDCSSLILVWFGERLAVNLDELIAEQVRDVAWEEHAVDGIC
jgi:hypothetical protein